MNLRTRHLLDETLANLGARQMLATAALACSIAALVIVPAQALTGAQKAEESFAAHGGYVWTVQPPEHVGLAAADCEATQLLLGVIAAGGPVDSAPAQVAMYPAGAKLPLAEMTPQTLRVWGYRDAAAGPTLYVGPDLADLIGIGQHAPPPFSAVGEHPAKPIRAVTLPDAIPEEIVRSNVVSVVPAMGRLRQCWVLTSRSAFDAVGTALPGYFRDTRVQVKEYRARDDIAQTPPQRFRSNPAYGMAGLVVLTLTLLYYLLVRGRKSELGLYRALGHRRSDIWFMLLTETGMIALVALVTGGFAGLTVAQYLLDAPLLNSTGLTVGAPALLAAAAWVPLSAALALTAVRGDLLRLLRDR